MLEAAGPSDGQAAWTIDVVDQLGLVIATSATPLPRLAALVTAALVPDRPAPYLLLQSARGVAVVVDIAEASFAHEPDVQAHGVAVKFRRHMPVVLVSLASDEMRGRPGVASRLFRAVARSRANILAIAQDGTQRRISLCVGQADRDRVIGTLHSEFGATRPPATDGTQGSAV